MRLSDELVRLPNRLVRAVPNDFRGDSVECIGMVGDDAALTSQERRQLRDTLLWQAVENANVQVAVGFLFVQPFASQTNTFNVPTAGTGFAFPSANVFRDMAYSPTFLIAAPAAGGLIGVSGTIFNLNGTLDRSIEVGGVNSSIQESGSISIFTSNIPEFKITRPGCCNPDAAWSYSAGVRFMTLNQQYQSTVTSPAIIRDLTAHQTHTGLGLTTKIMREAPLYNRPRMTWFGSARGSFTRGLNQRDSTLVISPAGVPATSTSASDNRTMWIPVSEFDLGLKIKKPIKRPDDPKVDLVTMGATFQMFGNAGPLSAATPNLGNLPDSSLFLIGGYLLVHFN